jgi:hypothetical protein
MGVAAAMLLMSSTAFAAGINLSWVACEGEGSGSHSRTFACAANTGTNQLVVSYVLAADLAQVSGNEIVIDVLSQSNPLPAWWDLREPGSCRPGSLLFNTTANPSDVVCVDWAAGQATGGIGYYGTELGSISPSLQAQHRRIKIALAVAPSALQDLVGNQEYFSCNVSINNQKTVGTGACAGCSDPVCIVLNSIKVTTPVPANDVTLGNANAAGSNICTWQGTGPDCNLVPTRNVTWGAVKSLYR